MKMRLVTVCICLAAALLLAGCGSGGETAGKAGKQPAGVNDVLQAGMAEAETAGKQEAPSGAATAAPKSGESRVTPTPAREDTAESVDVDLTALSSTMVYSEVYNMMNAPKDYLGKTVKMDGAFAYYHNEDTNAYYFACIIQDATACCSQGIEFVLSGEHSFPEDYPEPGEEICVVGVFDTYREGEYTYCTLRNASFL